MYFCHFIRLKYVEVELAKRKGHHKEETPVKGYISID